MVAKSCQVAFTNRQWDAYQFVLEFHRTRDRAPSAEELGAGLRIPVVEAANLISALTSKGILKRHVYHVLAIVPPSYPCQHLAQV